MRKQEQAKRDYYEILGVSSRQASTRSRRPIAKSKQYHPDHNPGDNTAEQKMKELNEACDIVRRAEARRV